MSTKYQKSIISAHDISSILTNINSTHSQKRRKNYTVIQIFVLLDYVCKRLLNNYTTFEDLPKITDMSSTAQVEVFITRVQM